MAPPADHPVTPAATLARTSEPLLWYGGSGHEFRRGPDYHFDCRRRTELPHVVLQLTLAGTGFHQRPGQPRTLLPPGRAFLDHIPGPFEYGWHAGTYELLYVSLRGEVAVQWMHRIHAAHGPVLDFGPDTSVPATLRSIVDTAGRETSRDRYLMSGQLYGLLMQILSVLSRSRVAAAPLVDRAIALIHHHAPNPAFNVQALARQLDCSREHLAREFRRVTRVSPLDYLTQHRLRLAGQALRTTPDKLNTVARTAGFSSAAYLCRLFRRAVGVTPAQFRHRPWLVVP